MIVLPREKDDTDSVYAVRLGLARGFSRFYLHGALGGERCSHMLANTVLLLWLSKQGAEGVLLGSSTELALLCEKTLCFPANARGYLSLFSLSEDCRVRLEGLKFPFDGQLDPFFPLGVSNEFTGKKARVTVCGGKALLVHEGDPLPAEIFLP